MLCFFNTSNFICVVLESQAQNDCFFEMAGIHAWSSPLFFFRYWAVFLCKNSNLALFIERYANFINSPLIKEPISHVRAADV